MALGDILLAFKNTIDGLTSFGLSAALQDAPAAKSAQQNLVYVTPGRDMAFTERGGNRVVQCQIYASVVVSAADRDPASATVYMTQVFEAILNAVDTDRALQSTVESCLPSQNLFFYTDPDQSQGTAIQLRWDIGYILERKRPR